MHPAHILTTAALLGASAAQAMDMPMPPPTSGAFCSGTGVVMNMGFEWQTDMCILLWFPGWVLDTKGKFAGACIGLIILAFIMSFSFKLRGYLLSRFNAGQISWVKTSMDVHIFHLLMSVHFAANLFIAYLFMLVVMTYNGLLVFSVLLGYLLGTFGSSYCFNSRCSSMPEATNNCGSQSNSFDDKLNCEPAAGTHCQVA
eukprot:Clim_evm4s249 gene=Clim_evmTU4s249